MKSLSCSGRGMSCVMISPTGIITSTRSTVTQ